REGRVKMLDFGLVVDFAGGPAQASAERIAGTPAYMAPEQATSEPTSPACDWYAVGTMLYEALTGRLPFDGTAIEILMRKVREEPAPPSSLVPGVPADLEALCVELLRRLPGERPSGAEVLGRITSNGGESPPLASRPAEGADRAP